jgi:hypothetical protein
MLKFVDCTIEPVGELAERLALNLGRLSAECYRPETIYRMDQAGWPGDWEGRTILALVSLWNALGTKPAYLDPIMESLQEHLNAEGYLGPVSDGRFDEQRLSGHNWLVRGLCEYWLRTGDNAIRDIILRITKNLYLPLTGQYRTYPVDPDLRAEIGSYGGTISVESGRWRLSTDIGCAYMCLDALSQVYELFRLPEVLALLDEMIGNFTAIDFVGAHMQTHATLSATRGILRLAEALKDVDNAASARYLAAGRRIFQLYLDRGMTENYANFNWFGRPDTWTEPCAIVDSMMAALSLFRLTKEQQYLTLANRIWYNALGYAQRPNGGYGTDSCVGPAGDILRPSGDGISEAFWCCTMRGSEGLRARAMHSVLERVDNGAVELWLPFATDVNITSPRFSAVVRSGLPERGAYRIKLTAAARLRGALNVYTPAGIDRHELDLAPGEELTLESTFDLPASRERTADGRKFKYLRGDLLLGRSESAGADNAPDLAPLTNMRDLPLDLAGKDRRRILFEN